MAQQMRPGDWMCPSCQNHNFAYRTECKRCGTPKEGGAAPTGAGAYGQAPPQQDPTAAYGQQAQQQAQATAAQGYYGQAAVAGYGQQYGAYAQAGYGQQYGAYGQQAGAYGAYGAAMGGAAMGGARPAGGNGNRDVQPGDWICGRCQNNNFARRTECNRCQAPRDEQSTTVDGVNPYAGAGGYAAPRPAGFGGQNQVREGDWMCPSCQNNNFAFRSVCHRCSTPKPENGGQQPVAAPQGQATGWDGYQQYGQSYGYGGYYQNQYQQQMPQEATAQPAAAAATEAPAAADASANPAEAPSTTATKRDAPEASSEDPKEAADGDSEQPSPKRVKAAATDASDETPASTAAAAAAADKADKAAAPDAVASAAADEGSTEAQPATEGDEGKDTA